MATNNLGNILVSQAAAAAGLTGGTGATIQPTPAASVQAAVHGPYEDLAIAGLHLIEKLIDGMSADQKQKVWQNWIDFWQPLLDLGKK